MGKSNRYGDGGSRGFDRDRGNRDQYRDDSGGSDVRAPRGPRAPLKWDPAKTLAKGMSQAVVSVAQGEHEKLYSFTLGRGPNGDKPSSKYNKIEDIDNLIDILQQIKAFALAEASGGVAVKVAKTPAIEAVRPD